MKCRWIVKFLIALFGLLIFNTSFAATTNTNAKNIAATVNNASSTPNQNRTVSSFNSLSVAGAFVVNVVVGKTQSIVISGDKTAMQQLQTQTSNDTLSIYYPSSFTPPTQPLNISITVPYLQSLTTTGASVISVKQLQGDQFAITSTGNQEVELAGNVKTLTVTLAGKNNFDAEGLLANNVVFNATGYAQAIIRAKEILAVQTTGDITVKLIGNPKKVSTAMFGNGHLQVVE